MKEQLLKNIELGQEQFFNINRVDPKTYPTSDEVANFVSLITNDKAQIAMYPTFVYNDNSYCVGTQLFESFDSMIEFINTSEVIFIYYFFTMNDYFYLRYTLVQ